MNRLTSSAKVQPIFDTNRTLVAVETSTHEITIPEQRTTSESSGFVLITSAGGRTLALELRRGKTVVGRSAAADFPIDVQTISRLHAEIFCTLHDVYVKDLGSTNGVRVNGERVDRAKIAPGDELFLGPVRLALLRDDVRVAQGRASAKVAPHVEQPSSEPERVWSASSAMQPVLRMIDRLGATNAPVLITGETGVGKEVVAEAIVQRSSRKEKPLRCINCGAIPSQLVESVFFGHEKGAFTGADRRSQGMFEQADGGTLLLDEIGELSPQAQASLLRVLESKRITRVGADSEKAVDVRIIAATHRDLAAMCRRGEFRSDLLYRLNVMRLHVPPLRERLEEIPTLVDSFLRQLARANGRGPLRLSQGALLKLREYRWPGNIRELRNVIERATAVADGVVIDESELSLEMPGDLETTASLERGCHLYKGGRRAGTDTCALSDTPASSTTSGSQTLSKQLEAYERQLISAALRCSADNQTAAAELLRMPRRTLVYKVATLQIGRRQSDADDEACGDAELAELQGRRELSFREMCQQREARLLSEAMAAADNVEAEAAHKLGISRRSLAFKLRRHGLRGCGQEHRPHPISLVS